MKAAHVVYLVMVIVAGLTVIACLIGKALASGSSREVSDLDGFRRLKRPNLAEGSTAREVNDEWTGDGCDFRSLDGKRSRHPASQPFIDTDFAPRSPKDTAS